MAVPAEDSKPKPRRSARGRGLRASLAVAPLGLLLLALPGHTEKTYILQTSSSPRIILSNLSGHVIVRGWDKSQVRAKCSTVSPRVVVMVEPAPATGVADRVHFSTRVLDTLLDENQDRADYTLDVPLQSSLEIRNRQGMVEIEKLSGDAWVDTVGASISASDVGGHLAVNSVGGDIVIRRASGRVEASTTNGNLHIISPSSFNLRANNVSGKIIYEGNFLPGGDYVLSDYSGEMEILCPAEASFELDAKSVKGKVMSDPSLALTRRRSPGQGQPLSGNSFVGSTENSSNATVTLTSFSGNIRIRRQP